MNSQYPDAELTHTQGADRPATSADPSSQETLADDERLVVGQSLETTERRLILKTLAYTRGHRTEAADMLGITTRTLRNKLRRYREQGLL